MKSKNIQFVIFLILLTVFLDLALGKIYNLLYFSEKSQKLDRLIHSAIGTNEDILIFGSSRAKHHYNPVIFEDSLKMTCYNVGYGGQNIYFHLVMLKATIARYKPKIVILDLFYMDFEKDSSQNEFDKLAVFLPFVNKSPFFYNAILRKGWSEKYRLLSSIYPLNSKQLSMVKNNVFSKKSDYMGFAGLSQIWSKPIQKLVVKRRLIVDSAKLSAVHSFIQLCKNNKIKLIVGISPVFEISEDQSLSNLLTDLKTRYSLVTYNFEKDTCFLNQSIYFYDVVHLNSTGAKLLSLKLATILKREKF